MLLIAPKPTELADAGATVGVIGDPGAVFPERSSLELPERPIYVGRYGGRRYFALLLEDAPGGGAPISDDAEVELKNGAASRWVNRRASYKEMAREQFWISARAYQIARWDRESRFCGRCGTAQEIAPEELAKLCPNCGHREYPRMAPAMIVAVVNRGRLLLAHAKKFREGLYSVLAGFVEPGESLEGCVAREVMEEAGVELSSIHYFSSQSWPFPYSMMVAFTAEASTEEISIDPEEIDEAGWFTPAEINELPAIPPRLSVSRYLIDWFVDSYGDEATRAVHNRRE